MSWIYDTNEKNTARFTLGVHGAHTLVCFGVNPSKASPASLDATVSRLKGFAERHGYDSWLMLNLYAQRATQPEKLHKRRNVLLHQQNLRLISHTLAQLQNYELLAAWGNLIRYRPFLSRGLADLLQLPELAGQGWLSLGEPTQAGHPRHPSRLGYEVALHPFDIQTYQRIL